jgi:nucleotide-binding universal stress UspA family protein
MKTMLLLTDFSEEAFRAAEYACELADCFQVKRIVIYNAYLPVMAYAASTDGAGIASNDQQLYLQSMESLALWQDRIKPMVAKNVSVEIVAEGGGILGISEWIKEQSNTEDPGLIVMGISHKSGLEKFLMGSATTEVLRKNEWPVLIVPENTLVGRGIKTVVFASDLNETNNLPAGLLHELLNALGGKLHVFNVERESRDKFTPELEKAIAELHELLDKYDPVFTYQNGEETAPKILEFADEQKASLILVVHKKHSFWSGLFGQSITRQLAEKSNIPVLSVPGMK